MGDLFGEWVSDDVIGKVIDAARGAPEWIFLFLTKNPAGMVDIKWPDNAWVGQGWVLGRDCQVALTGHPSQVSFGENFHVGREATFILDIKNEYGQVLMSEDRWLTLKLEEAGKAEVGSGVTIADGAAVEIHVHGSGKLIIPDGAVIEGEHFIEIADGEEATLGESIR